MCGIDYRSISKKSFGPISVLVQNPLFEIASNQKWEIEYSNPLTRIMARTHPLKNFFLPQLNSGYAIRLLIVGLCAFLVFKYICLPMRIKGHSMAPTYEDGGVNFCWRLKYLYQTPERHDIVVVRLAGGKILLLKRIVALPGERVAFEKGQVLINGEPLDEPYVHHRKEWNLTERMVKPGHVYLVGDNRGVPMDQHDFGQTPIDRIIGVPLW